MRTKIFITVIGVAFLFESCNMDDPIYETDHPGEGQITITTDWSEIGQGITKPSSYQVVYENTQLTANVDKYIFPNFLLPGDYMVYFYNEAAGMIIAGTEVKINTATAPTGVSGNFVEPHPEWLFTGKQKMEVKADTDHEYNVKMVQQVRRLTLVIEPAGESADRIEQITASLSGVAGTFDMSADTHGTPSSVALNFTKIAEGADAGKWSATVRLLGVTGSEQQLTGTIAFTGGLPNVIMLKSDLTTALANFNADKKTPLVLGGEIVDTPSGVNFGSIVNAWKEQETINGETVY